MTTTNNPVAGPAGVEGAMELLPCPFCGAVPSSDCYYMNQGDKWGGIQCCIQGPEVRTYYEEWPKWKTAAIAAWNTRATPADIAERARRALDALCEAGLIDHSSTGTDGEQEVLHLRAITIIAAEFTGGEKGDLR